MCCIFGLAQGALAHTPLPDYSQFSLSDKNLVMSSFVSFMWIMSPMWIVWCVIFIELFLLFSGGVYFWLQTTNRICHKYKLALFVFCTTVGKPSQSRSIFQPQPRKFILRHPLKIWQNTDVPEWPVYYSDLSVELHMAPFHEYGTFWCPITFHKSPSPPPFLCVCYEICETKIVVKLLA